MSEVKTCRLCIEACQKYKNLYDKNDRSNQLYEMTYKYLHPTIINMEQAQHLRVICLPCWRHIRDFHNFKLTVLVAQAQLNEHGQEEVVVKAVTEQTPKEVVIKTEAAEQAPEEIVIKAEPELFPEEVVIKVETEKIMADDIPNLNTIGTEFLTIEDAVHQEPQIKHEFEITAITGIYDETTFAIKQENDNRSLSEFELIDVRAGNFNIAPTYADDVQESQSETPSTSQRTNSETLQNTAKIEHIVLQGPQITDESKKNDKLSLPKFELIDIRSGNLNIAPTYAQNVQESLRVPITDKLELMESQSEAPSTSRSTKSGTIPNTSKNEHSVPQGPPKKQKFEITAITGNYDETSAIKQENDNGSLSEFELIEVRSGNYNIAPTYTEDVQECLRVHTINKLELTATQSEAPSTSQTSAKIEHLDVLISKAKPMLKCTFPCQLAFGKFSQLRKHILNDHPERKFFISCCRRRFHSFTAIEDHFLSHLYLHLHRNRFRCGICLRDLKSSDGLSKHMINSGHADLLNPENICDICDRCFKTNSDLRAHCNIMHGGYYRTKSSLQADSRTGYTCYKCGDVAYNLAAYRKHQCPVSAAAHVCGICSRTFKSIKTLRKHFDNHNRKKIYNCTLCSRMFTDNDVLRLHRKQDHGYEGEDGAMEEEYVEMDDVGVEEVDMGEDEALDDVGEE